MPSAPRRLPLNLHIRLFYEIFGVIRHARGTSPENYSKKRKNMPFKKKSKKRPGSVGFFRIERFPVITVLIILANAAVFFYFSRFAADTDLLSSMILSPHNLFVEKNFLSIIFSGFLHKDLTHLGLNMLGVFIFGCILENRFGSLKTGMIYFGALALSMSFSMLIYTFILQKNVAIIGASGALMGLISCAMLSDPFLITYETLIPLPVMLKAWMFIYADLKGFLSGETAGISHLSHLMGFLSVSVIFYFMNKRDRELLRTGLWINIFSFIAFVIAGSYLGVW